MHLFGDKPTVTGIVGGIKDAVVNVFNSLLSGIKNAMSIITGAVKNGFDAALNFIKCLPSQALQWGRDTIGGLIDGIIRTGCSMNRSARTSFLWRNYSHRV